MEIRLAIIGTFWLSETFLLAMDRTEGVRLAAVCSRNEEKAASFAEGHKGVRLYTDPQALANDPEIDAVYIATPNFTHYSLSKMMLKGVPGFPPQFPRRKPAGTGTGLLHAEILRLCLFRRRTVLKEV